MAMNDELRLLAEAEEPRAGFQAAGGVLRPGDADVTEVLLIRHGQMPATSDTRSDEPLTELGKRQADVLGRFLSARPLHALYCSPALRAIQTLRFTPARLNGRPVRVWVELPIQWTVMDTTPAASTLPPNP